MLAPIILALGALLLFPLFGSCVRRAIPLAMAGVAAWSVFTLSGGVGTALLVSFCALCGAMFILDELAQWRRSRPLLLAAEAFAGAGLVMTLTYAVLHSAGAGGVTLAIAVLVSGPLAASVSLRFRGAV